MVALGATTATAVFLASGGNSHKRPPPSIPAATSGYLKPPPCNQPDALTMALIQATADHQSGDLRMATICDGHLRIAQSQPAFVNITQVAWTTSGVVAVESIKGQRDHFVLLKDNGQREPFLDTLSGSLYGLTRNNQDELTFVRYDPATKRYSVLRDVAGNLREIANTAADFVFAAGLSSTGTYAVPETFRTPAGGFDGQLQLVSADDRSRIVSVPDIPFDVTWLSRTLLLIRADTSATTAGDYLFSLTTHKATTLAGGWLTICSYKRSVVVARLDGTIGLLSAAHPDGDAVQVVGKLPLLPLACAPTGP